MTIDLDNLGKITPHAAKEQVYAAIKEAADALERADETADEAKFLLDNPAFTEAVQRLMQSCINAFFSAGTDRALIARANGMSIMLRAMVMELYAILQGPEEHAKMLALLQKEYERLDNMLG